MKLRFSCLPGCNFCCIWRGYPEGYRVITRIGNKKINGEVFLGKEGVSLLPNEVRKVEKLAKKVERKYGPRKDESGKPIRYRVLPKTAVLPEDRSEKPNDSEVEFWQLMGRTDGGDICPFLSTQQEGIHNPIGALACLIYEDRFMWCHAGPLRVVYGKGEHKKEAEKFAEIDHTCQWLVKMVTEKGHKWLLKPFPIQLVYGLDYNRMMRIQRGVYSKFEGTRLWRYATGIYNKGEEHPSRFIGWVNWGWD